MFTCQAALPLKRAPVDGEPLRMLAGVPIDTELLRDYLFRTLWALVVAVVTIVVARGVRRAAMRALARHRAHANVTVLLGNVSQLLVFVLGGFIVVAIYTQGAFGWILTSFSVIGIVIGLSLQDLLKNFFAGIWVLVERPFRIGDAIEVRGYSGVVQEITFRTTVLRTADGREVIVPNADLMTNPVVNLSRFPARRASFWLVLPADAAADPATEVRAALAEAPLVAGDPPPEVDLRGVSDGKAHYLVSFWAPERDRAVGAAVAAVCTRFPQGEVHGAQ